jgi:hypothetical protein
VARFTTPIIRLDRPARGPETGHASVEPIGVGPTGSTAFCGKPGNGQQALGTSVSE